jgi:hypothetical protein
MEANKLYEFDASEMSVHKVLLDETDGQRGGHVLGRRGADGCLQLLHVCPTLHQVKLLMLSVGKGAVDIYSAQDLRRRL